MTILPGGVELAKQYAQRGWPVVLVHERSKRPRGKAWQKLATCDPDEVERRFAKHPASNLGVLLGPESGICDVEFDTPAGEATAERLLSHIVTPTYTSKRSTHRIFRYPETLDPGKAKVDVEGLEIRFGTDAAGAQSVFPPSIHETGAQYRWLPGRSPDEVEPADFPAVLVDLINTPPSTAPPLTFTITNHPDSLDEHSGESEGSRNDTLCRLVGKALKRGESGQELRSSVLTWAGRCAPPLPAAEALTVLDNILARERGDTSSASAPPGRSSDEATAPNAETVIEPYRPFPARLLPESLAALVAAGADDVQCDASFFALPILTFLGTAIGNTRQLIVKRRWKELPIIWAALVGKSGNKKSAAFGNVKEAVEDRQVAATRRYDAAMESFYEEKAQYTRSYKAWERSKSHTEPPPQKPIEPVEEKILCDDTTIEAIALMLMENPRGMVLGIDELNGWFAGHGRYSGNDSAKSGDLHRWLSMFDGSMLIVDRKTGDRRRITVPHAFMSLVGTIQPHVLKNCLSDTNFYNGTAARFLFVDPPPNLGLWSNVEIPDRLLSDWGCILDRLYRLDFAYDENGHPQPLGVKFAPDAKAAFADFHDQTRKEATSLSEKLQYAWYRMISYGARFSLILHYAHWAAAPDQPETEISEQTVVDATELIAWFKYEAKRVYARLDESEQDKLSREFIEWIRNRDGGVSVRDVLRCAPTVFRTDAKTVEKNLRDLAKGGVGELKLVDPKNQGPKVLKFFPHAPEPCDTLALNLEGNVQSVAAPDELTTETDDDSEFLKL